MSYVSTAIRWMHLNHVQLYRRSWPALPVIHLHQHPSRLTFARSYSAKCLQDDYHSVVSTVMAIAEPQSEDTSDSREVSISKMTPPPPSIPLDFDMESAGPQQHRFRIQQNRVEGSHYKLDEKHDKTAIIWDIFNVRLTKLPLNEDLVSHPGPSNKFKIDFGTAFSKILLQYSGDPNLARLRGYHTRRVNEAEKMWVTYNNKIIGKWLDCESNQSNRAHQLVDLLAGSLLISAKRMLDVLGLLQELDEDFEVRASCLYLMGFLYKSELLCDQVLMQQFDQAIDRLRPYHRWPEHRFNCDILRLLLWRSNKSQAMGLLSCLRLKYKTLSKETILLLASYCINAQLLDEAFALVSCLSDATLQKPDEGTMKVCAMLIKHDTIVETNSGPNFQYLAYLLERGLPPDDMLYSRVIENAMTAGYPEVAWDVYYHTKSLGEILLRPHTYWLLLRHAFDKQSRSDVDEILSQVHQHEGLYNDRKLLLYAMNMIRRLHDTEKKMSVAEALSHVLALYDRVWSRKPLHQFRIVPQLPNDESVRTKPIPDAYAISFTIWTYVLCQNNGRSVDNLWHRITNMVEEGNKMVLSCMNIDLIYNAFIWLNMKHTENFPKALEVLRYMLATDHCTPTSRTWSLLICGFLHHNQDAEAQKVYDLMQNHGFKIDHVNKKYMQKGATMADLRRRVNAELDEQNMLEALNEPEEDTGFSASSPAFHDQESGKLEVGEASSILSPDSSAVLYGTSYNCCSICRSIA